MPEATHPGPIAAPTPANTTEPDQVTHPATAAQPEDEAVLVTSDPPAPVPEPEHDPRPARDDTPHAGARAKT